VFHRPRSIRVARAFSDPPMNLVAGRAGPEGVAMAGGLRLAQTLPAALAGATSDVTVGVRAGALRVQQPPGDLALPGQVELAEISGSDTFVHVHTGVGELVAQLTGVHDFALGAPITLHLAPADAYVFGADGELVVAAEGS
jgi:glycerol transport system ATP-binding protein